MKLSEIRTSDKLEKWLADKPTDWAQAIALRAALRTFPRLAEANTHWLKSLALLPIRALLIAWSARSIPDRGMVYAAAAARDATGNFPAYEQEAAISTYYAVEAAAQTGSIGDSSDAAFFACEAISNHFTQSAIADRKSVG